MIDFQDPHNNQALLSDDGLVRTDIPDRTYGFKLGATSTMPCGQYQKVGMYYQPHMHTYVYLGHNGKEALWRDDTQYIRHDRPPI